MNNNDHFEDIQLYESDQFQFQFSVNKKQLKIISLTTSFRISGISPIINLYHQNEIVPCLPNPNSRENISYNEFNDKIGQGVLINIDIEFIDRSKLLEINLKGRLSIKVYKEQDFCTFQIILKDLYNELPLYSLHSISPFSIQEGEIILGKEALTKPENITFFENGFQSWSYSKTRAYNERYEPIIIDVVAGIHQNMDNRVFGNYVSEFVTAISDIESKGSLILGFCTLADAYSRIVMNNLTSSSKISWLSAYSQFDNIPLNKIRMKPISSEELFVTFRSDGHGYSGLVKYAEITGRKMNVRIHPPKTGWCTWYYYYTDISNNELLANVDFFNQNENIPIDLIQLDDGYLTAIGDFLSFNEKFPSGIKDFVNQVHSQNKHAGIWIAPFLAAENSNIFKEHPEWFIKSINENKLIAVLYNWNQIEYALDCTHQEVQEHIKQLIYTIFNTWKIDFIKIDFLYASSVFLSSYNKKGYTRAQVYRKGIELIRNIIGSRGYLLGCGAPLGPSVGVFDAMRVSEDTKDIWETEIDPIYGQPCLKWALINSIYRSFMHNNLWVNDPDCLIIRKTESGLNEDEIKLQITVIGLTGGQVLISDNMQKLEDKRLKLAMKLIPPYSETAIPVDALYAPLPSFYVLETDCALGSRVLVAVFNWEDTPCTKTITLREIISPYFGENKFFIFDWWNKELIGCFSKEKPFSLTISAHSCRYLGIIPWNRNTELENPVLLASTLHITQGCKEISELILGKDKLGIKLALPGSHEGEIFVLFPKNFQIPNVSTPFKVKSTKWGNLFSFSLKFINSKIVHIHFIKKDELPIKEKK